jgi:hypothetical protein
MEIEQGGACRLRRSQNQGQQQARRLVLAELIEIPRPLAACIANKLSAISEALRPRRWCSA